MNKISGRLKIREKIGYAFGDAADYSEWKNGRRATGLVYSAGTFAMKFGGGIAGAVMLMVMKYYGYLEQTQKSRHLCKFAY